MAYQTPTYDYGRRQNELTTNKGLQDIANNYGRFLSQERFRRTNEDSNRTFQERMPQVGRSFNRRNMYHSGMRREGQRKEAEAYQRNQNRNRFDYAAQEQNMNQVQSLQDAGYQNALLALYEDMQRQRAAQDAFSQLQF